MTDALNQRDLSRLEQLAKSVASKLGCPPGEAVDAIAKAAEKLADGAASPDLAGFAAELRRLRARRGAVLGSPVFRDPSWDMLLDLLAAHHRGDEVCAGDVCVGAGVPSTTALRHLDRLEASGLVRRERDRADHRRMIIRLAPDIVPRLEGLLAEFRALAN